MSKNKENVMKPNKEQKGKNAVLIIAVGKHATMGPGERKKGMKKAFNVLKRDDPRNIARKRAQRKAKYEARLQRRQAKQSTEKPAPKRVENAPPSSGNVAVKRTQSKRFNTDELPKIVERFSLGNKDNPSELTETNKRELARLLRLNPEDIRVGNPALENSNAYKMLENMGRMRFQSRDLERKERKEGKGRIEDRMSTGNPQAGLDEMANRFSSENERPDSGGEEEREAKFMERLRQARSTSDIEDRADKRRRTVDDETESKTGNPLRRYPAFNMQPFGHTGKTMDGFRDDNPDKHIVGFKPPMVAPKLSSPQEEDEEPELPEYPQFATGTPMDLAFRLLKDDENTDKTFLRPCNKCGVITRPGQKCRCD